MSSDQFKTPLDVLEFPRATLYTPAPGVDNERSSLNWSTLNGQPRVTVWTRVDDKEKGPIQAGIGHEYIQGILGAAEELYRSGKIDTIAFDNMKNNPGEDGRAGERVISSTLMFGRDEEGVCFVSLTSNDDSRPRIIFPFTGFVWHKPRRKSGPIPASELSTIQAVSMISYLRDCFSKSVKGQTREELKEISERRKAAREGKKSYNRQGSFHNKQQTQGKSVDMGAFDEDIGF